MITSKNTILFGYALWLLGRTEFEVPIDDLRETMARWHFMAHITARYSGSAETRGQEDIKRIDELDRTPEAFISSIDGQVTTNLTEDWWQVTLPEELHTSSMSGPAYTGYLAALNILDAEVLLSTLRVKDWLDPSRRPVKGAEKHHLFPKAYLKEALGYSSVRQINQVANQALVEWSDNIDISNQPPSEYWPHQVADKDIGADRVAQQMRWHGLPENWTTLSYDIFPDQRRHLIAEVAHEGFRKLSNPNYQPSSPPSAPPATSARATFEDLVREDVIPVGTRLTPTEGETDSIAEVGEDGTILLDDDEYFSPDLAAKADGAHDADGWSYWTAHLPEPGTLEELSLKAQG